MKKDYFPQLISELCHEHDSIPNVNLQRIIALQNGEESQGNEYHSRE